MVQIRHPDYFEELNSTDKNDISSSGKHNFFFKINVIQFCLFQNIYLVKLFLNSFDPDVLSESIRKGIIIIIVNKDIVYKKNSLL